jgi:hypothetical protein
MLDTNTYIMKANSMPVLERLEDAVQQRKQIGGSPV